MLRFASIFVGARVPERGGRQRDCVETRVELFAVLGEVVARSEREDANLIITRNSFEPKYGSCDILSVRKSKRVKRAWIVRERCTGGDASVGAKPITTISRYTRRDVYLYVYPNP